MKDEEIQIHVSGLDCLCIEGILLVLSLISDIKLLSKQPCQKLPEKMQSALSLTVF